MSNGVIGLDPQPKKRDLPIRFGRLLDFTQDPISCMRNMSQQFGWISALQEEAQRIIFAFGPQWNQQILSDPNTFHSRFFAVRGPKDSAQRRLTSGLLSMNGQEHRDQRRLMMGPFLKKAIAGYQPAICKLANQMLDEWKIGEVCQLDQAMIQFMLQVTSSILFGLDYPELAYEIGSTTSQWVKLNHQAGMGVLLSDSRFLEYYDQLNGLASELENKIRHLIQIRLEKSLGQDVLSLLLRAYQDKQELDHQQLIGQVALMFGAAHLTTAHSLTRTTLLLAQHPHIMQRLSQELDEKISGSEPNLYELEQLHYLDQVIKESMRILPASSYSVRVTTKPVNMGPFRLGTRETVIFSQYMTHHIPSIFANPKSFLPDRWIKTSPSPYEYLPFGTGPRMCLGGPLALLILKSVIPMICKRYRISVIPQATINAKVISTMLGPTTTVPVLISPPDGNFECHPLSGNICDLVDFPDLKNRRSVYRHAA